MRSGQPKKEKSVSGRRAHNALPSSALLRRVKSLKLHRLEILTLVPEGDGRGHFYIDVKCLACLKQKRIELRNAEQGRSTKCRCLSSRALAHKFPNVSREVLKSLGGRYQAMRQRCNTRTHVSSARYQGRGIKVIFKSSQQFVSWALSRWPDENFQGKDFDRIDNDGHYEPANLRLVDRTTNLLNRPCMPPINVMSARKFLEKHPQVVYTERTVLGYMRSGCSDADILRIHAARPKQAGRRKYTTY